MKISRHLYWLVYATFLLACARQTAPTGGPKDTIPPEMTRSFPKRQQTNFEGKRLEIEFSEFIALNNPKEQILITPDIEKKYKVTSKKNLVIIELENTLKDSTTYSINFRDAVQDITEKNPAENLKLAFSTGTYIDSLSIQGIVYDLQRGEPIKDATVALYSTDTFDIFKHKPSYITKSNTKGYFLLENLKQGDYYIYAFDDKNRNLLTDSRTELYGFLNEQFYLSNNLVKVDIPIIKLDARPLKLTSSRPYNTYYNIKTSKGLLGYKIYTDNNDTIKASFGEDRSNIKLYNTFDQADSIPFHLQLTDSINNTIDTVLYAKFLKRQTTPEPFDARIEKLKITATTGNLTGQIAFTKPLLSINWDSIYFQADSTTRIQLQPQDITIDDATKTLVVNKSIDKKYFIQPEDPLTAPARTTKPSGQSNKNNNQFYIGKAAFVSIDKDSSAAFQQQIKPTQPEQTGMLIVHVSTNENHFIVEVVNKNFEVVQRQRDNKKPVFSNLEPGEYQLRLLVDKNNDGTWTAGNFFTKSEPEPIQYYTTEKNTRVINLKANWEVGPLLITY
jgi:uncharacterized protein (DUF2141 family)